MYLQVKLKKLSKKTYIEKPILYFNTLEIYSLC